MRKSKCRHCIIGTVLDEKCDKVIGHCWCEIDQYDEEIGCNPSCYGYSNPTTAGKKEGGVK